MSFRRNLTVSTGVKFSISFSLILYTKKKKRKMSENGKINRIFWFVVSYFIKEQCEYVNVNFEKQTCKFTDNRYNTFRRNRKK